MKTKALPLLLALLAANTQAEVRLSEVFGEHMVLQRDRPLRLWGQATPGQTLSVYLGSRQATTQVGTDGRRRAAAAARTDCW
jgi:sialate O-acetylesterase